MQMMSPGFLSCVMHTTLMVIKSQKRNIECLTFPLSYRQDPHAELRRLVCSMARETDKAHPCASQEEAFLLLKAEWIAVSLQAGISEDTVRSIACGRLCREHGWMGLETRVAYQDQTYSARIRTYLHVDGAIVIQCISQGHEKFCFTSREEVRQ